MADTEYMYLFCRKDLSSAQQIIQASHAASKIGELYHGDTHITLCGADSEDHLQVIASYLDRHDIHHTMFWEPDLSGFTAIATQPLAGVKRRPLRKFKLL